MLRFRFINDDYSYSAYDMPLPNMLPRVGEFVQIGNNEGYVTHVSWFYKDGGSHNILIRVKRVAA